jgi:CRP-like cAMP-binding protein
LFFERFATAQHMPIADIILVVTGMLTRAVAAAGFARRLPEAMLERIARDAKTVTFLAGDTVIEQGEQGDALYIVMRGRLKATPCTLLRLARDDVLRLAQSEPEVLRRLEASHAERIALAAGAGTVADA